VPADVPTTGPNLRSPGERPPVEPVVATQHSAAGAEAFAEFFIRTIDWGYATMSGAYLRHYSMASCVSCTSIANGLDRDRKVNRTYIGGRLSVVEAKPGQGGALQSQVVSANGTAFEIVDQHGKPVSAEEAHTGLRYTVQLRWQASAWVVRELTVTV
jgi:hypothetical protein